jgi:O-antigen/teichoic acid export membrane protein
MGILNKLTSAIGKMLELNVGVFSKNFSYVFANNIITIIFAMALSVMLARVLSKDVFGQYNFILSTIGIISILTLPGINTSITRSSAKGFDGSFVKGTKSRIKWSFIGAFILLLVGMYYYIGGHFLISFGFMVSTLFFISYYSFRTYQFFLLGKKRFKRYSFYLSFITIVANLITMVIAYHFRDLVIVLFALLGTTSLINFLFLLKTIGEKKNNVVDKDTVPYGKHLTLVSVFSIIKSNLDKIIVGFLLGFEALAIYSIAIIVPRQVKPIWTMIGSLVFPDLSKKNKKGAYSAIKKRFKYAILLEIIIIIAGIIIIPPIILYFYSGKYVEAVLYAQLLMFMTLSGPAIILSNLVTSQKQLRKIYKITIIPPIINILLLIILIPPFGLLGACIATIVGSGFISLLFSWFVVFGGKKIK